MPLDALTAAAPAEASAGVRQRVEQARQRQRARAAGTGVQLNSHLSPRALRAVAAIDREAGRHLAAAATRLGLSGRAVHRTLRVARTIADLDGSDEVGAAALLEALQFRAGSKAS